MQKCCARCVSSLHLGIDTPRLLWWSGPMKALRVAAAFNIFFITAFLARPCTAEEEFPVSFFGCTVKNSVCSLEFLCFLYVALCS